MYCPCSLTSKHATDGLFRDPVQAGDAIPASGQAYLARRSGGGIQGPRHAAHAECELAGTPRAQSRARSMVRASRNGSMSACSMMMNQACSSRRAARRCMDTSHSRSECISRRFILFVIASTPGTVSSGVASTGDYPSCLHGPHGPTMMLTYERGRCCRCNCIHCSIVLTNFEVHLHECILLGRVT